MRCIAALLGVLLVTGALATAVRAQTGSETHPIEAAAGGHGEGEAGADKPSIMKVEPGLIVWTWITFGVLVVVLRFTAWKPLMTSLEARERRIREAVEGAERARRESEELLKRHQEMLDSAMDEARKIIEEGKADGLKLKHEIAAQARTEAEEFKARAMRELELATEQAKKDLWEHSTRLATELAEKILMRSLTETDHRRLVEQVLDEYRAVRAGGTD